MAWLKPQMAAEYAGISKRTIFEWIDDGLPSYKVRGARLIKTDDIDMFIMRHPTDNKIDAILDKALKGLK